MHLTLAQIVVGSLAALVVGLSKTGIPGAGILVVPMMAFVFGGRLSVGATLPMLIVGDVFAVAFYRAHTDWPKLRQLAPWVVAGLLLGTAFLRTLGQHPNWKDPLSPIIGGIVLVMLAVTLLRKCLGDRLVPHSPTGSAITGGIAGFSTMVANAAGPIMQIYLISTGMDKDRLMGTAACYFFIFNLSKVPLQLWLTFDNPSAPLITLPTFLFNLAMFPLILVGAYLGKWLLPRISQQAFNNAVLVLTALAAVKLLF